MIPPAIFTVFLLLASKVADAKIGINWGRQTSQISKPSSVVGLLLQNDIKEARIFNTEEYLLRAFDGSGIGLTVTVSSASLISTIGECNGWVESRKRYFTTSNIKRVYLTDYALENGLANRTLLDDAMTSLECLQKAINDVGYGDHIKVTVTHLHGVLKLNTKSFRPSETEFGDEIKQDMAKLIAFLKQNNAPFVVNIFPIGIADQFGFDLDFLIPDNKSKLAVKDVNGAVYTNVVELFYDSYVWALQKLNASDVKVIIGQAGWPTDGHPAANATMANRFFKALLPWVAGNKGTPMRPGVPIDTFIHTLVDEDKASCDANSTFLRHWGVYTSNGKPKYKIDFSGQGRDVVPADATAIMQTREQWCVFNGDKRDWAKVRREMERACKMADCSKMVTGASCSLLGFDKNVSYAFNMYFQAMKQNPAECNFDGLAYVVVEDPSTLECVFPIEGRKRNPNSAVRNGYDRSPATFAVLASLLGFLLWN